MAKKQTTPHKSLNPFNEGVVKIISASISFHLNGRSSLTRTFRAVDGSEHTFNANLPSDIALKAIEDALQHVEDPLLSMGSREV